MTQEFHRRGLKPRGVREHFTRAQSNGVGHSPNVALKSNNCSGLGQEAALDADVLIHSFITADLVSIHKLYLKR